MKDALRDNKFRWLLVSVIISISLETVSLLGILESSVLLIGICLLIIISVGRHVIIKGFQALYKINFSSINLLMLLAVIGAFYLGEYTEATVVIVLYTLGERLEELGLSESKSALQGLVNSVPKSVSLKGTNSTVSVESVSIGSIIIIKPFEMIPIDSEVLFGQTTVDEASITGEPMAKFKQTGDIVYAGTLNQEGYIEIKTIKRFVDSTFSKIAQLTFQAASNKSETQKFIQKFSRIYTPSVVVLSLLLFLIPTFFFGESSSHWLKQAITLLVISCPCALVISTPVAIYAAIGNASKKGAMIKGGKFIEVMGQIKAVAMDKTRTITTGKPIVADIRMFNNNSLEQLLGCSAGIEVFSEHPLAIAILNEAIKRKVEPHKINDFKSIVGKGASGICTTCGQSRVMVGKLNYIQEHIIIPPQVLDYAQSLSRSGKTIVLVSRGSEIIGLIGLTDTLKEESEKSINELKELEVIPIMLSGDNERAVQWTSKKVGIEEAYGGLLPEDKTTKIIQLLNKHGKVAMVGDGVNDTPALAQSSVGIAMGAMGSDIAIEAADIALMNDNLLLLPKMIRLGRKTIKVIKRNTILAVSVKALFIVLAFMGFGNLVLAIAADVGVTLLVILLSMRLTNFEK
jgi:Cd2+/Zn2+-exporting ATPase